jgi:hypothetical protein
MIAENINTPTAIPPRSGVSPIGTTSPNSGATAATNSTYGVGVFTSGISEQAGASYTLQNTDYQGIIIFDSGATVNVTLNSNVTPNFQATILNLGSGPIALATSDGSAINGGPSSLTLAPRQGVQVFFANRAWLAYAGTTVIQIVPQSIGPVTHKWLNSYNATTGLFTESQPNYSDLTGTPQLANTKAPVSHEWLASYDATTGNFTQSQPSFADISGNLAEAQLPTAGVTHTVTLAALTALGTQGSITFTNGICTNIVDPT